MGNKLTSLMPWWLKIGGKMVLARVPVAYSFWQSVGLFRHGTMDSASYALDVFDAHICRAGIAHKDLAGKTILELGPGDSIATAMIAHAYGAKAILIDSGDWARTGASSYFGLHKMLSEKGLLVPSASQMSSVDSILEACGGRYITSGLAGWQQIEEGTVDFVFSQAVLEHVKKDDFLKTQEECWRVMTASAVATHQIDLKDHLGGALNNLRFSERIWESDFFSKSGFYTNRLRKSDLIRLFHEAGFSAEVLSIKKWEAIPTPKKNMAWSFASASDDELIISEFDVRLKKI